MSRIRSDLWCAAFIRRHNDLGQMCVVARKGDPVAGQIWIEVDHLNGTVSLFAPAPGLGLQEQSLDRQFERRFDKAVPERARERLASEIEFDPDVWIISLESRSDDPGITIVNADPAKR